MLIDGIETLTAVTAILSVSVRSSIVVSAGFVVFRYIGSDDIAATPRTSAEPRVALHSVMNAGGPAAMKSTEPDSSASFMTAGPPRSIQRTVRSASPAALCVLLDQRAIAHHEQRQEADAAGAERNANLGRARRSTRRSRPRRRVRPRSTRDRRCGERRA